ncbi:MAG: MoxR family ATPase [Thermodesulfobacteriota bacterium]|nr:MoxR family ATPase [Thermodesulfobacteriota bacterium]
MKPSDVSNALVSLVSIGQPLFLWGPPGIGKSDVVKAVAADQGLELKDIRAVLLDPVDLRGIPGISPDGTSRWYPPDFLPRRGKGILFLDELNAAPPLVQAGCYQLVLDRCLGEYRLPDGWSVVAAGNREEDRSVVHHMPSALANRFVHLDFTVDVDDWIAWALNAGIAPEIIGFIRFRPGLLHDFKPDRDDRAFPSPRSWEFVARLLSSEPDPVLLPDLVAGAVGKGASAEFTGFLDVWNRLPEAGDIIADPHGAEIPSNPAVLFALCEMMGHVMDEKNMESIMAYAARLPDEFSVLMMREAVRRNNALVQTQAFAQWAACCSDVLV